MQTFATMMKVQSIQSIISASPSGQRLDLVASHPRAPSDPISHQHIESNRKFGAQAVSTRGSSEKLAPLRYLSTKCFLGKVGIQLIRGRYHSPIASNLARPLDRRAYSESRLFVDRVKSERVLTQTGEPGI